jgi:flavodoxin
MAKVLVVYYSQTGMTEKMASYIAEGIRFTGNLADTEPISKIIGADDLKGYDGYIFGAPTISLDVPEPMKAFLNLAKSATLKGKLGGAFGPYRHEVAYAPGGKAAEILFDTLENALEMEPFELGPLRLKEAMVDDIEGLRACQAYGKAFGEELGIKKSEPHVSAQIQNDIELEEDIVSVHKDEMEG